MLMVQVKYKIRPNLEEFGRTYTFILVRKYKRCLCYIWVCKCVLTTSATHT